MLFILLSKYLSMVLDKVNFRDLGSVVVPDPTVDVSKFRCQILDDLGQIWVIGSGLGHVDPV